MSAQGTLNNQIVEALRRGNRDAVAALIGFGVAPTKEIDLVSSNAPSGGVTTRSAWFWSHQSSCADAVGAWWEWMNRSLGILEPERRADFLAKAFAEAIEASLPENGETLLTSWEKSLEWTEEDRAPGWSRSVMMAHLSSCCSKLGNTCIPGFIALEGAGFINKSDWSDQSRQRYARDPLTIAVKKGQVDLVETLLDMGCSPITQTGLPILAEVWADFLETAEQSDNNLPGECEASLLMMEKLLTRGLDWNVPLTNDKDKTVAQDAEGWIDLLKALPSRWERVTHQIEARILSQNTAPSTKKVKSPRSRL
jgi:hypothetical protein